MHCPLCRCAFIGSVIVWVFCEFEMGLAVIGAVCQVRKGWAGQDAGEGVTHSLKFEIRRSKAVPRRISNSASQHSSTPAHAQCCRKHSPQHRRGSVWVAVSSPPPSPGTPSAAHRPARQRQRLLTAAAAPEPEAEPAETQLPDRGCSK